MEDGGRRDEETTSHAGSHGRHRKFPRCHKWQSAKTLDASSQSCSVPPRTILAGGASFFAACLIWHPVSSTRSPRHRCCRRRRCKTSLSQQGCARHERTRSRRRPGRLKMFLPVVTGLAQLSRASPFQQAQVALAVLALRAPLTPPLPPPSPLPACGTDHTTALHEAARPRSRQRPPRPHTPTPATAPARLPRRTPA